MFSSPITSFVLRRLLSHKVDVAICGGGVVGSTLAASLKRLNLKTMIVDVKPRVEVTASASKNMYFPSWNLRLGIDLDIWSKLQKYRSPQAIRSLRVWDVHSPSEGFTFACPGEPLAHIVETDILKRVLHDKIVDCDCRFEHELVDTDTSADSVQLELRKAGKFTSIEAKLLIITTGWDVGQLLYNAGFEECINLDYNQSAISCILKLDKRKAHCKKNDIVYNRFLSNGSIVILPLSENYSFLSWNADENGLAEELRKMSDEDLLSRINGTLTDPAETDSITKALISSLNKLPCKAGAQCSDMPINQFCEIQKDSRRCFPLKMILPESFVIPRIALIGDSAHRIHSPSGQDINLGLADAKCLSNVLKEYLEIGGDDIGALHVLKRYEMKRQCIAVSKGLLMDAVKRVGGSDFSPFVWARTAGNEVFKRFGSLRNSVLRAYNSN
ncbi:hypothetical protein ACOME3_001754 [Neoechinorhynchus agilis]